MTKIYLRYNYRGWKSNERVIPAGEYDVHNPLVAQIAAYLVDNGHAIVLEAQAQEAVEPEARKQAEVEFTRHAVDLMTEHGIAEQDMLDHFSRSPDIEKFLKSHVEQYLEDTTD